MRQSLLSHHKMHSLSWINRGYRHNVWVVEPSLCQNVIGRPHSCLVFGKWRIRREDSCLRPITTHIGQAYLHGGNQCCLLAYLWDTKVIRLATKQSLPCKEQQAYKLWSIRIISCQCTWVGGICFAAYFRLLFWSVSMWASWPIIYVKQYRELLLPHYLRSFFCVIHHHGANCLLPFWIVRLGATSCSPCVASNFGTKL